MSTLPRINGAVNQDNTFATLMGDYQAPAYASTIAILTSQTAAQTLVRPATLTGAVTFTVNVGNNAADDVAPYVGDTIIFLLKADGSARIATFGTGFTANGTLSVAASTTAVISFWFNGTTYLQTEVGNPRNVEDIQTPVYAASIAVTTTKKATKVIVGQLTGALTVTAVVTAASAGDSLVLLYSTDGTQRVVTYSTNLASVGTLTIPASKFGSTTFVYNGTTWVETGRAITA